MSPQTLLRTSALVHLFRALVGSTAREQRRRFKEHIGALLTDLLPLTETYVVFGTPAAGERSEELEALVERTLAEGSVTESRSGWVAVPVYVRGRVEGVIAGRAAAADVLDALVAVSVIASSALESAPRVELNRGGGFLGASLAMQQVMQMVDRVAHQESTVLILGESGTGKELVARALHERSPRRHRPFVAINCAAIAETLLESELFGHERGAFTGAATQKAGKLEAAEGGTVLLDEVGELARPLQAKLLRVLQEREFERLGGTRSLRLNVRVLAATNRDLAAEVTAGRFRQDLYHRLNVVVIKLPPLRERPEDILPLAQHFLERSAPRCGKAGLGLSAETECRLTAYSWPGNVRELENAIERAAVFGNGATIEPEDLPEAIQDSASAVGAAAPFHSQVADAKRQGILRAWQQNGGDYKLAAKQLGVHPNSLLRMIRKLGLRDILTR